MDSLVYALGVLLIMVYPSFAEKSWRELEREVVFHPWSAPKIDELRTEFSVAPQGIDQKSIPVTLPKYEKAVYKLGWGAFNAGYAILEIDRRRDTLKLAGKAVTNKFITPVYRVRDYVYSLGSSDDLYPYFFEQWIEEKEYHQRRWTLYDFKRDTVFRYTGKELKRTSVKGDVHNYMTLLYALRNMPLGVGDDIVLPCYVHDKYYDIHFHVLKKEDMRTLGGKRSCYKIQPILVGEGEHGFNKKDKMYLWITDDSERVLVKVKAKERLGHVYATLYYYENGTTQWQD